MNAAKSARQIGGCCGEGDSFSYDSGNDMNPQILGTLNCLLDVMTYLGHAI